MRMLRMAAPSMRRRALDRDAVQEAALAVIVVEREVPGRAIVPQRQRALPPMEAAGEFGADRVAVEIVEERARLVIGPAVKAQRKAGVDVERLAAGLGVANDDGVDGILRR